MVPDCPAAYADPEALVLSRALATSATDRPPGLKPPVLPGSEWGDREAPGGPWEDKLCLGSAVPSSEVPSPAPVPLYGQTGGVRWPMPVILGCGRLKQEDCQFEASQGYY